MPTGLFLLLDDELLLGIVFAGAPEVPGEAITSVSVGGPGKRGPSVYYVPFHQREDDIEEQVADAVRELQLQQLAAARGTALANRLEQKRIDDARALSLMSAQRSRAMASDPLHRPQPVTAASLKKRLRQERERPSILPQEMRDDLAKMQRDAALEAANKAREEKKRREEEIRQTRLKNLEKARKAKAKKRK